MGASRHSRSPFTTDPFIAILYLLVLWPLLLVDANPGRNTAGMLGMGGLFTTPNCATACRSAISSNKLLCDPNPPAPSSTPAPSLAKRRVVYAEPNSYQCYISDAAFLRTLALCLEKYCEQQEGLLVWRIEKWWAGHVSTGIFAGNFSEERKPIMPYGEALRLAKEDVARLGGQAPVLVSGIGKPLNTTSQVNDTKWRVSWSFYEWYERVLFTHVRSSVGVAISSVFLPVLLSLFRFLPGRPLWYSRLVAILERPLIGHRHRVPSVLGLGHMPTLGQSLYLLYLITTQIILAIFPLNKSHSLEAGPRHILIPSRSQEILLIVAERTGMISMGNFVALFLFSTRNNILLWITNWSQGTFLLLHGWIGYCTVLQICLHSILMVVIYRDRGSYGTESKTGYWVWGIVGTLAVAIIWPLSTAPVRRKVYEAFLLSHQVLAFLTLLGTYLHIVLLFGHDWKFEIWVYVGGLIWALDRVVRLVRLLPIGWKKAIVTSITLPGKGGEHGSAEGDEVEYLRIDVDGAGAEGHVYLYFPTLSWKVWENHPFSVLSTFAGGPAGHARIQSSSEGPGPREIEKASASSTESASQASSTIRPRMTIVLRLGTGITRKLAARLLRSSSQRIAIPVLVEAAYHSNHGARADIGRCTTLLCFAGGVGITGVVPLLKSFGGVRGRLCWGVRDETLVAALDQEFLSSLGNHIQVQTSVGSRLDVKAILREELMERDEEEEGDLAVVGCGPPGMADDVRLAIAEYGSKSKRGVVFVDEAFSW